MGKLNTQEFTLKYKTMEKDTVLLSVEQYNELRDFKKKIEEGFTFTISTIGYYNMQFITIDETIGRIVEVNKGLQSQIEHLRKELPIHEIKKMSVWQFLKWKKS